MRQPGWYAESDPKYLRALIMGGERHGARAERGE
jgi:hypothetical protein